MINISIGGVPEHFNLPWHLLLGGGDLAADRIAAQWEDYPSGTGAMVSALNDQALDVAVVLTEGAVAGIANGGEFRIVSLYTRSPLIWGIHVPAQSPFEQVADLREARYAISRLGSGSHLMACAHARAQGWANDNLAFEVVGSLDGAIDAFARGSADAFLWEKFMTKPVVDSGLFRRIGEFIAPWPAFVICVSQRALRDKRDAIAVLLERIFPYASAFRADPSSPGQIAARYGLERADAAAWLSVAEWASEPGIDPAMLDDVADALAELGLSKRPLAETFTARIERRLPAGD